jgi:hypothetical protein
LIAKRGAGDLNVRAHSYRYGDIVSVDVKWGTMNPLGTALTELQLTVASSDSGDMPGATSFSSAKRLMDAPNIVAFGWTKGQKAAAREAVAMIEEMIESTRQGEGSR